jgi:hypothetical protein
VLHNDSLIKTYALVGGVLASVRDHTRHYFGGYYHVRIRVSADVPVSAGAFADSAVYQDAFRHLGTFVSFSRDLEKMAVPDSEIDAVRRQLLASFDANVLPYLLRADFAASFVQSEYRTALKSCLAVTGKLQ